MKLLKKLVSIIILIFLLQFNVTSVLAHGGRTDANGGHRDNKNASGLGNYHYHHGREAHLHPNGVCPYENSSSSSSSSSGSNSRRSSSNNSSSNTAKLKEAARSEGYQKGHNDGKSSNENNPSVYSTDYRSEFDGGYAEGYEKGAAELKAEQEKVRKLGDKEGYVDGYAKKESGVDDYKDKYSSIYKTAYLAAYKRGETQRQEDIKKVERQATKIGKEHGYLQEEQTTDYGKDYQEEYEKAYKKGYQQGVKQYQQELTQISKDYYKNGVLGTEVDFEAIEREVFKEQATLSYEQGQDIYEELADGIPLLGSRTKVFQSYFEKEDKLTMQLGELEEEDQTTLISFKEAFWGVKEMDIYLARIHEDGLTTEELENFFELIFSEEVTDSYERVDEIFKGNDEITYRIIKLKRIKGANKTLPRRTYLIMTQEEENITHLSISKSIPREIKRLETL